MKVGASHTPSQTLLPLTSRSPRTHRWVPSHSPTVSCAYRAAGWCQPLPPCVLLRCPQARVPQLQPAGEHRSAQSALSGCRVGVGEEAHTPGSGTGAHGRNKVETRSKQGRNMVETWSKQGRNRLALHRGRAWTFTPADLAGQDAPRHRTFSRILGSGDRP